tara:strand:- start:670 stop:1299 length:630 start_codon:yes stop_codon:yes gene_type:complete
MAITIKVLEQRVKNIEKQILLLTNKKTEQNINVDNYDEELLKERFNIHKSYILSSMNVSKKTGITIRLPGIPEDISENFIKMIIHNKFNDKTCVWNCKGDLESQKEGKQECKCFTSDAPISFTPSSNWDVIYFLDARNWLHDKFILYKVSLIRTSEKWKNIKMNKTQTFEDQCKQGRRPRICWKSLYSMIESECCKIYEGTFNDIFIQI